MTVRAESLLLDFPALQIPADIITNIRNTISSIDCIDSLAIRHNADCYLHGSTQLTNSKNLNTYSQKYLDASWTHQQSPIVRLPVSYTHNVYSYSTHISALSNQLHHIATIADLAKKYSSELVERLDRILTQLNFSLTPDALPATREKIIANAYSAAASTSQGVATIAQRYRSALDIKTTQNINIRTPQVNAFALPPLYASNGLPTVAGIDQMDFGDCYFLANIGALAHVNPAAIKNSIKADPAHPGAYLVTLFHDANGHLTTQRVAKDELLHNFYAGGYIHDSGQHQLWPYVLETAWAKVIGHGDVYQGDNQLLSGSGNISPMMHTITGKSVTTVTGDFRMRNFARVENNQQIRAQIAQALTQHRPVTMSIGKMKGPNEPEPPFICNGHKLPVAHAYMVLGVQGDKLLVRNPWGHRDRQGASFLVSPDELGRSLAMYAIGGP